MQGDSALATPTQEVAGLFGDSMTQEELQEFLSAYAGTEMNMEVQGSLVSIFLTLRFDC